jgi:hypothetical protein
MAGAGKKTFTSGEVLTASDVNGYLMDQAVMRFASSAARGSAIASPTEGMVSYRDDDNVVEVYDGAAWAAVSPDPVPFKTALLRATFTYATGIPAYFDGTGAGSTIRYVDVTLPVGRFGTVEPVVSVTKKSLFGNSDGSRWAEHSFTGFNFGDIGGGTTGPLSLSFEVQNAGPGTANVAHELVTASALEVHLAQYSEGTATG